MTFHSTPIHGAFLLEPTRRPDFRGSFARLWSARDFRGHGLAAEFVELNTSLTLRRGTIRGLHYQVEPHGENKLVRCTRGAIHDVIVDLRPDSPSCHRWASFELSADSDRLLYVPSGCAHGVQAVEDDSEMIYLVSAFYHPAAERGLRWDDPRFGIRWPVTDPIVSDKDRSWPDYGPVTANGAVRAH